MSCSALRHGPSEAAKVSATPTRRENFRLLDHKGQAFELDRHRNKKLLVFVGFDPKCEKTRALIDSVASLKARFENQGVDFYFIYPNPVKDRDHFARSTEKLGNNIPILLDEAQIIASGLGLRSVGDVSILRANVWPPVYQGALPDSPDLLQELLDGKAVQKVTVATKSCSLPARTEPVTYKEFANVFETKCLICHTKGLYRPNNLNTVHRVGGWSPMIREVIRTGRMPPWLPDTKIGRFHDDWSLTPDETYKLVHWIESGRPFDEKTDHVHLHPRNKNKRIQIEPDVKLPVPYVDTIPASGPLRYRTYALGPAQEDYFVRSMEINDLKVNGVTHHFTLMISPKELSAEQLQQMYLPELTNFFFTLRIPLVFPQYTYVYIPRGHHLYIRGHYEVSGKPEPTQPQLEIWKVPGSREQRKRLHPLEINSLSFTDIKIPPHGRQSIELTTTFAEDVWAYALSIHMHMRGEKGRMTAVFPDGKKSVLLWIPNFDYRQRQHFELQKPLFIPKGTKIIAEGTLDNSSLNPSNPNPEVEVRYGPALNDDMYHARVYYWKAR